MTTISLLALGLFLAMLIALEAGRRLGLRQIAEDAGGSRTGLGTVEGSVFGLLGLLVAFTFAGAANRYDARRVLIVEEANAIGTAWARVDLLAESEKIRMRADMRRYVDSRIEIYRLIPDMDAAMAQLDKSNAMQREIWNGAVAACGVEHARPTTATLLLPALNAMFDMTTRRTAAALQHPPLLIFALMFVLSIACSVLAGHGMAGSRHRSWVHMIGFAGITAIAVFVILDLEYPRMGTIRMDDADELLVQVRATMG